MQKIVNLQKNDFSWVFTERVTYNYIFRFKFNSVQLTDNGQKLFSSLFCLNMINDSRVTLSGATTLSLPFELRGPHAIIEHPPS